MPAVFNLSSWAAQRAPLAEWLIDELRKRYDVPRRIATRWVDGGEILPLLDGLDEVAEPHRAACVKAINAFRDDHGLVPFAVCSRTEEYAALAAQLRVEDAVELQPPTRGQVYDYLEATGTSLADVQAVLRADPTLWDLLESPLVLSIVALTYGGQPAEALRSPGTPEQRLALLFEAYTERMLTHRPGHLPASPDADLAVLARPLDARPRSERVPPRPPPARLVGHEDTATTRNPSPSDRRGAGRRAVTRGSLWAVRRGIRRAVLRGAFRVKRLAG